MLRHFVKGGIDHFSTLETPLHIRNFFRSLVYQQHDQFRFRVMFFDAVCDFFKKDCFTGFRRCNYESSLSFSDRCHQVDEAQGKVPAVLQNQPFIREDRSQRFEIRSFDSCSRLISIDGYYVQQCAEAVSVIRMSANSFDFITGL